MSELMDSGVPGYTALVSSGQADLRIQRLYQLMDPCELCPRRCGAKRLSGETGYCSAGNLPVVADHCAHHGEEPPLSGTRGSGAVFFAGCNLKCLFCQNHQVSQPGGGLDLKEMNSSRLAGILLELQGQGCHNINFVSPTHFAPQMAEAVIHAAKEGLNIPVVYNSNGYDSVETLRLLEGIIDIFLPDLKYVNPDSSGLCCNTADYFRMALPAAVEMKRQVGHLRVDRQGIAVGGLIVRHLVLPNGLSDSTELLGRIYDQLGPGTAVSLMAQYYPAHRALDHELLGRRLYEGEYQRALGELERLGLNGWTQDLESHASCRPDFSRQDTFRF